MAIIATKKIDYYLGYALTLFFYPLNYVLYRLIERLPHWCFRKNIVFFKIVGGGSLLIAAPTIYSISLRYPDHRMVLFCSDAVKPFADRLGVFDQIVTVRCSSIKSILTSICNTIRYVFATEIFINLEYHSKLSSLFSLWVFSKIRVSLYSAYNHIQLGLINIPIYITPHNPIYESYKNISDSLMAPRVNFDSYCEYFRNFNNIKRKNTLKNICIAPFCSDIYPERELSDENVISLIRDNYNTKDYEFYILGGKKDSIKADVLTDKLIRNNIKVKNLVGQTSLSDVVEILTDTDELLTIDSGLIHLARFVGAHTYSIWGPSDPISRLDGSMERDRVMYKRVACSPCVHTLDQAPCKGNNLCIKQYFEDVSLPIYWKIK